MSLSKKKIDDLTRFYLRYGFAHTTEETARHLGISHKTFFNRYTSKEESVRLVLENWYADIRVRFMEKAGQCNHAVEELLHFVYEIRYIRQEEAVFFEYAVAHGLFLSGEAPFRSILSEVIRDGIRHYQFREDLNVDLYGRFLLCNLSHYHYMEEDKEDILRYLVSPLLSQRGWALLEEMDVASFL